MDDYILFQKQNGAEAYFPPSAQLQHKLQQEEDVSNLVPNIQLIWC